MSKKRKTLQQKIAARERLAKISLSPTQSDSPVYSIQTDKKPESHVVMMPSTRAVSYGDYSYVAKDARKTLLVIGFLVGLNVVVYFLLQSNVLPIKF